MTPEHKTFLDRHYRDLAREEQLYERAHRHDAPSDPDDDDEDEQEDEDEE